MARPIELISKAEYARRRGCTQPAVLRAINDGRITLIDGKIDPVAADAQWERNSRPRLGSRPAIEVPVSQDSPPVEAPAREGDDYWSSKARREAAEAEMAELKLAEQRGELVRAAAVRTALAKKVATLRETLLQLPSRVVPLLVATPDAAAMDRLLREEITLALTDITRTDG
jgi:hypothetical protein